MKVEKENNRSAGKRPLVFHFQNHLWGSGEASSTAHLSSPTHINPLQLATLLVSLSFMPKCPAFRSLFTFSSRALGTLARVLGLHLKFDASTVFFPISFILQLMLALPSLRSAFPRSIEGYYCFDARKWEIICQEFYVISSFLTFSRFGLV